MFGLWRREQVILPSNHRPSMAPNGFSRVGRSGKTPHFLTVGLLVVICILTFNYWTVSSQNKMLQKERSRLTRDLEDLVLRRLHLEKRGKALEDQVTNNNLQIKDLVTNKNECKETQSLLEKERDMQTEKLKEVEDQRDDLLSNITEINQRLEIINDEYEGEVHAHEVDQAECDEEKRIQDEWITKYNENKDELKGLVEQWSNAYDVLRNTNTDLEQKLAAQIQQSAQMEQNRIQVPQHIVPQSGGLPNVPIVPVVLPGLISMNQPLSGQQLQQQQQHQQLVFDPNQVANTNGQQGNIKLQIPVFNNEGENQLVNKVPGVFSQPGIVYTNLDQGNVELTDKDGEVAGSNNQIHEYDAAHHDEQDNENKQEREETHVNRDPGMENAEQNELKDEGIELFDQDKIADNENVASTDLKKPDENDVFIHAPPGGEKEEVRGDDIDQDQHAQQSNNVQDIPNTGESDGGSDVEEGNPDNALAADTQQSEIGNELKDNEKDEAMQAEEGDKVQFQQNDFNEVNQLNPGHGP